MFWQYLCDTTQKPSLVKATVSAARRAGCLWYAYVPDIFVSGKKETAELLLCSLRCPPCGLSVVCPDIFVSGKKETAKLLLCILRCPPCGLSVVCLCS